ncbi:MAG: MarR family transcriptional regulator [Terracoccus sp.]
MPVERKPSPEPPPGLLEPAGLEASTGYLLARVGSESRRAWARTLAEEDLTPHHYSALIALDQLGAMSQQQLSHLVGIDPRNAVPVIDQLQTRGLLARNPDPTDRRRHAITLTATGRKLLTRLRQAADEAEGRLLTPLTTTERRTLHVLLAKLFAAAR